MCARPHSATPTRISCVAWNSNQDRIRNERSNQKKKTRINNKYEMKLKFVRTQTHGRNGNGRRGHHFCNVDHRKHCAPYAPSSVVGNKISQCAESLCNMSSWHHENAIPKRRNIKQQAAEQHYGGPSHVHRSPLTLVGEAQLFRFHTHCSHLSVCLLFFFFFSLPTRCSDHITRLILF